MKPFKYAFIILTSVLLVFTSLFSVSGSALAADDATAPDKKVSQISLTLSSLENQPITLTAKVSGAKGDNGVLTGTVKLLINGIESDDNKKVDSNNQEVTFQLGSLSPGKYTFNVTYSGDNNYKGSGSIEGLKILIKSSTTTTVTSNLPYAPLGQWVTFTAQVKNQDVGGEIPTGTVTFKDGNTTIGTATLTNKGNASIQTSSLSSDGHTITAEYNGDSSFNKSTSSPITQTIVSANNSVQLTSSNPSTIYGQSVTFTAKVTGAGSKPGSVTFRDGTKALEGGSSSVDSSGNPTFTTSMLEIGTHLITATYSDGTPNGIATSNVVTLVVSSTNNSSTSLSSSNTSTSVDQYVTFTATVSGTGGGTPTGTVTFKDGSTSLGTSNLDSYGRATLSTRNLSSGYHYITAVYNGNSYYRTNTSNTVTQNVGGSNSNSWVSISSSNSSASYNEWVTFTATVSGYGSGTPTGRVTFKEGSTTIGTGDIDYNGRATFSTNSLSYGTHYIKAVYQGNGYYDSSTSNELTQVIGTNRDSWVSVSSSAPNSSPGQWITFTATVSGYGNGTPTGSVTFKDGSSSLGTTNLDSSGRATFSTSSLSNGNHSITAVYNGNSYYSTSTSSSISQMVGNYQSTYTSLTQSMPSSNSGQWVTFTATVNRSGGLISSGSVTFKDGSTTLGTSNVDSSGKATFSTGGLSTGSHSITAVYSGNNDYSSSTSSAATHTVYQGTGTGTGSGSSSCQFGDIGGHWAERTICDAAAANLVKGISTYQYSPNEFVTRAEFITMLGRVLRAPSNESTAIKMKDRDDVPSWAKSSVNFALNNGILKGSTDGNLYPNQNVNRGEMAVIIAKAMKWGIDYTVLTSFADDYDIPSWAKPFVAVSVTRNVLRGRENNLFMADAEMTRAEAAVVILQLNRLLH